MRRFGKASRSFAGRFPLGFVACVLLVLTTGCPRAKPHAENSPLTTATQIRFVDITEKAGIRFRHFNGAEGGKYMPETMSGGGAVWDYDGDGWDDILLLNGRSLQGGKAPRMALYHNRGDGTFEDKTQGSGLETPIYAMGCCVGDYDNDGRPDLFITAALESARLYHNEGAGKFRDVTKSAGLVDGRWGASCAWLDFNDDGRLDLFVTHYVRYRSIKEDKWCSLEDGRKSYCTPETYEGEANALYQNQGDGTFRDVSAQTGIGKTIGKGLGVALADFDDDGYIDILVANDKRPNFLFHNVRAPRGANPWRRFEEIGTEAGIAMDETGVPKAGMGIDAADYRNNGTLGVLVSNFSNEGLSLYAQQRKDLFSNVANAAGLYQASYLHLGFGLCFVDLDNDGWLDIAVGNGHVYDEIQRLQNTVTHAQRKLIFRNRGDGAFEEIGEQCGEAIRKPRVSRGVAYGDFDNDGRIDLLILNNNDSPELLHNETTPKGNWLEIEVRAPQLAEMNRDCIGAKVTLTAGGITQTRLVRSGSSYLTESMRRLHFGLGAARFVDRIEVRYPGGAKRILERVAVNQRISLGNSFQTASP